MQIPNEGDPAGPRNTRRRRPLFWILLLAAVATAAAAPKVLPTASLVRLWNENAPSLGASQPGAVTPAASSAAPPPQKDRDRPLRVTAMVVRPTLLAETLSSTGTLLAEEAIELQPEVNGKITAINFTEGAHVSKGDLLVKLNDADLRALHVVATHELELAERRERRTADLLAKGFVNADEYDIALNGAQVRRADIAVTKAQIDKTEIRAPFDGIAGLRYVSEGAFVNATTRIATLQRTEALKLDFAVPERYADQIKLGSPIVFTVAGREEEFHGEVYAYDPRIDVGTRTLLIRALCPNPGGALLPGTFANVKWTVAEAADALLVPAVALIPDFNAVHVFVARDGIAHSRRVEIGIRTDSRVQIVAGLEPGEVVITSGLQQLRAGAPVEVELDGPAISSIAHR